MNVSCEIKECFQDWRDWFLLEEDKEKGMLKLFVNGKKVIEKNIISHFSLLQCKIKIANFNGVISSISSNFNSPSLSFYRIAKLETKIMDDKVSIFYYDISKT